MFDTTIAKITSKFLFPAYHGLLNDGLWRIIKNYEESQWKTSAQLKKIQKTKLQELLYHCQINVTYYRKLFEKLGLAAEELIDYKNFLKIPYLTKRIINSNQSDLCAKNFKRGDLIGNSTSGSTGENLYFYQDKNSLLNRQAVVWRNQLWVHCFYTDKQATLWGAPFDLTKSQTLKGKIHSFFTRDISLSSFELSDDSFKQYVKILKKFRPRLLVSYPSPLTAFAEYLLSKSIRLPSIKSIITSAEKLFNWQKEIIKKAFECPIYDRYGCREFGNIAHECDKHEGYHVNIERFFLEILDENGQPCKIGEAGEIYVTDLDNFGFPFLRYKIEDLAVSKENTCSCGRGLPLLDEIEGRTFDIIRTPNGNRIGGTFWTLALRSVPGIKNFQVEQASIQKLVVRLVVGHEFSEKSKNKVIEIIKDKCGREIQLDIEYMKNIPLTKSGKKRFVISRL